LRFGAFQTGDGAFAQANPFLLRYSRKNANDSRFKDARAIKVLLCKRPIVHAVAQEIKAASDRGESDDGSHYYQYWLATLERLVAAKGLSDSAELLARKEACADAYRHTPHGKPVELAARKKATS